ncbi:MAG: hypothetical protein GXZ14_03705 [Ruminococcaceae bacterium]|nr:hypothetical protein [Oscillospiraceae bacterium]
MDQWEEVVAFEQEEATERLQEQLALEQQAEEALALELEKHPIEPEPEELPQRKKLRREIEAESLALLEDFARTETDFQRVVDWWDKLDANRERRERYHEITRNGDDLPLDYGAKEDGLCYPDGLNGMLMRQIRKGDFLEAIFYCPYEVHELVTPEYISKRLRALKEDSKELLFLCAVQQYTAVEIAKLRKQTDRNIRKTRTSLFCKLQKQLYAALRDGEPPLGEMTLRERCFIAEYKKTVLDESKNG